MPVIILGSSYTFFPEVGPLSKAQIYPVLLAAIATLLWVAAVSVFLQRWSMPTRPQKQKKKALLCEMLQKVETAFNLYLKNRSFSLTFHVAHG